MSKPRWALAAFKNKQANISLALRGAIKAGDLEAAALGFGRMGSLAGELGRRDDAGRATEKAVALRRRLARDRPDAFNPDLAMSLSNLAELHDEMGQTETAIPFDVEAIETMREPFFALPAAHARMMQVYVRDYRARCQKLEIAPDAELLGPIDALLERPEPEIN